MRSHSTWDESKSIRRASTARASEFVDDNEPAAAFGIGTNVSIRETKFGRRRRRTHALQPR